MMNQINVPIAKPGSRGPEQNPWFWNPNRDSGLYRPSEEFLTKLHSLDDGENLRATWNPILERWQLWHRAPRLSHPICQGWKLLFIHNAPDGSYLPLDELVLARLWSASGAAQGSGRAYFQRITDEMEREKSAREKRYQADLIDSAMPSFEHSKISVSKFGHSNGSKFATYQAG